MYKDKNWLFQNYITLDRSRKDIADEVGVDGKTIGNWLRHHGIRKGTRDEVFRVRYKFTKSFLQNQYLNLKKSARQDGERIQYECHAHEKTSAQIWYKKNGRTIKRLTF